MEYKVNTLSAHEAILLIQQLEVEKAGKRKEQRTENLGAAFFDR